MWLYSFDIADIVIELRTKEKMSIASSFQPFCSDKNADYHVSFSNCVDIPNGNYSYIESCYGVDVRNGEQRFFFPDQSCMEKVYAYGTYDMVNKRISVQYLPREKERMSEFSNCFYYLGLEKIFIHENRVVLHSCCINTEYGGICFSGESGIGKSTQGDLWAKYEDAKIINGDRPVIYKNEESWLACGSPYAGSSRIYCNEKCPIRAIVLLKQAHSNTIRRIKGIEAFTKVFQQITVNSWDKLFVEKAVTLVEQLIDDIPIYELSCTPDQKAVNILKNKLKEEK